MKKTPILNITYYIIPITFLLFSCSKKKVETPHGVLSRQQMVPILADVHIAQAATSTYITFPKDSIATDSARYTMNDYLPYILKIHHTTKAQYDSSIVFYTAHPEMMQEMYDSVITELSKKQGEVSAN